MTSRKKLVIDLKVRPNFMWDDLTKKYYVEDRSAGLSGYLTNENSWTFRWKERGLWKTFRKAMKSYQQWSECQKEKDND